MRLKLKRVESKRYPGTKFKDYDIYILYDGSKEEQDIPITTYRIDYHKRALNQKTYYRAEIEYQNLHIDEKDSPYVRKGYTTKGLVGLKKNLIDNGIPWIFLSINPTNFASQGVARKARIC